MNTYRNEKIDGQVGAIETKETVDIQSPPGENKEPRMKNVGVVHLTRDDRNSNKKEGGVLAGAADAAAKAFQYAKDAISGRDQGSTK
ncbi:hypothetical protein PTKIN_Ptkin01aG0067700 [Pterospermum kingtungense]